MDVDLKSKVQRQFYRDERKRRDAFVLAMKELFWCSVGAVRAPLGQWQAV